MRKMSRKIFHKSLHNSCPFFQIAAGGGVGYNSGTREALIKSARAVSESFLSNRGIEDGEILYVFPVFDTEEWAKKIRSQPQTI